MSEQWLIDTIQNNEVQPLDFYDMKPYLVPDARGIAWDTPDPVDESVESLVGEVLFSCFIFLLTIYAFMHYKSFNDTLN